MNAGSGLSSKLLVSEEVLALVVVRLIIATVKE